MRRRIRMIAAWLVAPAMAGANLTLNWTNTQATVLGTNFTLNLGIDSFGYYSVLSTENVPAAMQFTASGSVPFPALFGKSFALTFSSVNGQNFESHGVAGSYRIGMTGGANKWRFDQPTEVARIAADLAAFATNQTFRIKAASFLNTVTNSVIGLRDSSGTEQLSATNPASNFTADLTPIAPVLKGGSADYFEFRAAEGSAGGWSRLEFEFQSDQGALAPIRLANIFASGCVLQRDRAVAVWGTSEPGETVTVEIKGQSKSAVADSQGSWRVELDPEPAGGPFTMAVSGAESAPIVLANVYFGDVWILAGQSNMFQTLAGQVRNFPDDYPPVPDETDNFDDLRLAIVSRVSAEEPAADAAMDLAWRRWEAGSLADMSAVGYFFARKLKAELEKNGMGHVPLGLVKVCRGGTSIEEWVSAEDLAAAKAENPALILIAAASGFYNGMVAPIQDYAIKGALWYQGEGNASSIDRISQYPLLKRTLAESWRRQWKNPDLPLYFVQLAPYRAFSTLPADQLWAWMRESQESCLATTNTAMACIIDGGLQGDIHPPFKDRVGERLARIALAEAYGLPVVHRGPALRDLQVEGADVLLTFDHAAGGLETRAVDSQPDADEIAAGFPAVSVSAGELAGFALCGADRVFHWATQAEIVGSNQVRIANAADVPAPVAVRYAWQDYPRCNLFNSEGLPAGPFRTDAFGHGTSSGADSTPWAKGIADQATHVGAGTLEVDLSGVFIDIEDGGESLLLTVSSVSNSNVVSAASIAGHILSITLSGTPGVSGIAVAAQDSAANIAVAVFSVAVESSVYKAWRHGYFTAGQLADPALEETLWGDLADPDGDGLPNLLEYGLALNPVEADQAPLPFSIVQEDGWIKARFPRSRQAAADTSVEVGLMTATELGDEVEWAVLGAGDVLYRDLGDAELREAALSTVADAEPALFVRLYVARLDG